MKRYCFLFLIAALLSGSRANAGPRERTVLALIITSNKSLALGRPELRYADDDGAKYYDLFRMLAAPRHVRLLTQLDPDTRALFPHLVGLVRPPSRAQVQRTLRELSASAGQELARGREVEFYFVYAGHGDVDEGTGFVELTDGRFTAHDLERALESIKATRSHVILDSCNSYFLINARRPGGRRFATPEDAAQKLARRMPNVGVFLSTSSEADVYEWSELQSGIFSHAVRSGLSGAADIDGDGRVSYRELEGFVGVAASRVKNPLYRPQVFARGPAGSQAAPIFELSGATATRLEVPPRASHRLTVRDAEDVPRIDAHNEAGTALSLYVPAAWYAGAEVEERQLSAAESRVIARYALAPATGAPNEGAPPERVQSGPSSSAEARDLEGGAEASSPQPEETGAAPPPPPKQLLLADLRAVTSPRQARGPDELFRMLFASPFGPRALASFERERANQPAPVYGLTDEDIQRMRLVVRHVAGMQRSARQLSGGTLGILGLAVGAAGLSLALGDEPDLESSGWVLAGTGAAMAGIGAGTLLVPSRAERVERQFEAGLANATTPAQEFALVAETESGLRRQARKHRRLRTMLRVTGGLEVMLGLGLLAMNEAAPDPSPFVRLTSAYALGLGGVLIAASYAPTPAERMIDLWESDPGRVRRLNQSAAPSVKIGLVPAPGGALLGLGGRF